MSTQLAIADISPRRPRSHVVMREAWLKPAETLPLEYGLKEASIFSLPWPGLEERAVPTVVQHTAHSCGLGRHFFKCWQPDRCTAPFKLPCESCETKARAGYRAGRYAR
jgi:hypothetical protein